MSKEGVSSSKTIMQDSFTDHLMCELTAKELLEISKAMADSMQAKQLAEKSFDDAKQQFKANISKLEATVELQASLVRSGKELRPVKCHWEFDFDSNKKNLLREDTGEIIQELEIEEHERQVDFFK